MEDRLARAMAMDAAQQGGMSPEDKAKLDGIAPGAEVNVQSDWNEADSTADDFIKNKPAIPTVNDAALTIQKNGTAVGTFSANAATAATINITVPVDAEDVAALPDTTKYGASLSLSINSTTYVVTASLKDQDGNTLGTAQTIDLPLETVVVGGSYDDTTKKVILTLKNGTTVDFSVSDLVAGLQTEITSMNKLDADLVDDTTSVHKFVTAADKTAWNAKSDFSGSYNDLTDKPTIPAAQVNADWNATSGAARILNKPTIYTKPELDTALAAKLNTSDVDATISSTSTNPVQNKVIQASQATQDARILSLEQRIVASEITPDGQAPVMSQAIYNALAAKLNTSDVDATISSTSTNPVQNKAVQAPIARLVDAGAKNLLYFDRIHVFSSNGVTFTVNSDGTISTSGTATGAAYCSLTLGGTYETDQVYIERFCDGKHMLAGCPSGGNYSSGYSMYAASGTYNVIDEGNGVLLTPSAITNIRIIIMIRQGTNANGLVFKPMICTTEDWAVSHKFVPYAPTNRELYEMILALQNAQNGG